MIARWSVLACVLAACACATTPPTGSLSWQGWSDAPIDELTALLGPPDTVEERADGRTLVYRRYRITENQPAPSFTDRDLLRQPSALPTRRIELCETRVRTTAAGVITSVDQSGIGCNELGPAPPERRR